MPGEEVGGGSDTAFSVDAFELDDRLRLFNFAAADKRTDYLWVLRGFEHARANYVVLLHVNDVAANLAELADDHRDMPTLTDDLTPLLDQLYGWRVLERSYDGARAASLAEYRNRHYVYQFSQAGYRAYRAVEDVLGARMDDATLSRLVFPELLEDLQELAEANAAGAAEQVYRKLSRLDFALTDMATRAARFYLMLGDLSRTNDTRPEIFLAHKDTLLAHMREFSSELSRYSPRLAKAIGAVEATGIDRLVEHAAEADDRIFASFAERLADWRQRWTGLVNWFQADTQGGSESARLQSATVSAISAVLALLRRITEARRGGVSRESQLRHLATWFTNTPSDAAAHALFAVAFNLRTPRHVGVNHPDAELVPARRSWWEAPPVELSRTLVETGKTAKPGPPARLERNDAGRRRLREQQLALRQAATAAARSLAEEGVDGRVLDEAETELLLGLLDLALATRTAVSGAVSSSGSAYGVRLTLRPHPVSTQVCTVRGRLHLDRLALVVSTR